MCVIHEYVCTIVVCSVCLLGDIVENEREMGVGGGGMGIDFWRLSVHFPAMITQAALQARPQTVILQLILILIPNCLYKCVCIIHEYVTLYNSSVYVCVCVCVCVR